MFEWLRGRRRLSAEAKRRLLVIAARSEENLVETHVANILDMVDMLADEVDIDRAIELYGEMIPMDEHVGATVSNRVIARHESPQARRGGGQERAGYRDVFREGSREPRDPKGGGRGGGRGKS